MTVLAGEWIQQDPGNADCLSLSWARALPLLPDAFPEPLLFSVDLCRPRVWSFHRSSEPVRSGAASVHLFICLNYKGEQILVRMAWD